MKQFEVKELEFEADTAGAVEETRVNPKVIVEAIKAVAKVITDYR